MFFEPDEEHWHGAAPTRFMTHLAMLQADDDGTTATWGAHVTEEEYGAAGSAPAETAGYEYVIRQTSLQEGSP